MSKLNLALVAAVLALSLIPSRSFAVTNAVVGTCKAGTQFTTIQAAVKAATSGSTVSVCPGTYAEQIVIQTPLTLKGIAQGTSNAAIIRPPAAGLIANSLSGIFGSLFAQVWVHNVTGVTLSNLVIDGGGGTSCPSSGYRVGVLYQGSSGLMINSSIIDAPQCAHTISALADVTTDFSFTNNILTECGGICLEIDYATATTVSANSFSVFKNPAFGIEVQSLDGPAAVTNNSLTGNLVYAVATQNSADVTITGNTIVTPSTGDGIVLYTATRNLVQNNHITSGIAITIADNGTGTGNTVNKNTIKDSTCGISWTIGAADVTVPNTFFTTETNTCSIV